MSVKYLRQVKTGTIYISTPTLEKRRDMVPHDPEIAKVQIETRKRRLDELRAMLKDEAPVLDQEVFDHAKELEELDKEIEETAAALMRRGAGIPEPEERKSPDDLERDLQDKDFSDDPEIKKITEMEDVEAIEAYVLAEYGIKLDKRRKLEDLREQAIAYRKKRLLESPR